MKHDPTLSAHELGRLEALHALRLLDTPPEEERQAVHGLPQLIAVILRSPEIGDRGRFVSRRPTLRRSVRSHDWSAAATAIRAVTPYAVTAIGS